MSLPTFPQELADYEVALGSQNFLKDLKKTKNYDHFLDLGIRLYRVFCKDWVTATSGQKPKLADFLPSYGKGILRDHLYARLVNQKDTITPTLYAYYADAIAYFMLNDKWETISAYCG